MIKNGWIEKLDRLKKYENMWKEFKKEFRGFVKYYNREKPETHFEIDDILDDVCTARELWESLKKNYMIGQEK